MFERVEARLSPIWSSSSTLNKSKSNRAARDISRSQTTTRNKNYISHANLFRLFRTETNSSEYIDQKLASHHFKYKGHMQMFAVFVQLPLATARCMWKHCMRQLTTCGQSARSVLTSIKIDSCNWLWHWPPPLTRNSAA